MGGREAGEQGCRHGELVDHLRHLGVSPRRFLMPRKKNPVAAEVAEGDGENGSVEKWNNLHTLAFGTGYYALSANPLGNGSEIKETSFYENVSKAYLHFYKKIGGTSKNGSKVFRPRIWKACKNKWQAMNKEVMRFLS